MRASLETIKSPETISATLEVCLDTRSTVSISPPGIKDFFTSFILKIDGDRLHISQVMPQTGNGLFKPGQPLNVRISHKGTSYRFESRHITYVTDTSGFCYHEISLPTQIHHLEKRSDHRVHLKPTESQPIKVAIPFEECREASLENISHSGACLRLKGHHAPLETCDVIDCNIQIANAAPLTCKAVIKHCHFSPKANETKAGVEFCPLSFPTEKQLHRMLMKLQRHNNPTDPTI